MIANVCACPHPHPDTPGAEPRTAPPGHPPARVRPFVPVGRCGRRVPARTGRPPGQAMRLRLAGPAGTPHQRRRPGPDTGTRKRVTELPRTAKGSFLDGQLNASTAVYSSTPNVIPEQRNDTRSICFVRRVSPALADNYTRRPCPTTTIGETTRHRDIRPARSRPGRTSTGRRHDVDQATEPRSSPASWSASPAWLR